MDLVIVRKQDLTQDQLDYIDERLALPAHAKDLGPPAVWKMWVNGMYAAVCPESNIPIGIIEASGLPPSPGWWIDSEYRRQGYGYRLVDALAAYLKLQGVTTIGHIKVDGDYQAYSEKLKARFLSHFHRP